MPELREPGLPARALLWVAGWFREPQTYGDRFPMLAALLVASLIANVLRDVLRVVQEYLSTSAVLLGINDLRGDAFNVALRLPLSYFAGKALCEEPFPYYVIELRGKDVHIRETGRIA